mmetsp:Transcript_25908/g.71136  ORF Transcript_25908/g.71136 Transcript_25908/m.71136 type:complete len:227 (-) Transcript_25908:1296-1976(-)|eukprot:CAMPEP_0172367544 /NCGR_PEP_ID=MMETSP1060-20121228/22064_1 /TAXON_ID=37318 /ORGANISM="Pseudo-nitzschia pungens, Strain cf. cingulata" /LENGTH=226 /DNA_ID=CAMNT_0013091839 /DNA_START=180 /DNA_END=863 /DNA_ORIENTATION=-
MNASRNIVATSRFGLALLLAVSHLLLLSSTILAPSVASFATQSLATRTTSQRTNTIGNRMTSESSSSSSSFSSDKKTPEITKQLERAKAALAKSRAKMEAQEQASLDETDDTDAIEEDDTPKESLPFFAATADPENKNGKKDKVIKNKNEEGLFTTDGDLMAKLSEEEEWESRPLLEVFQNEKEQSPEAMNIDRDIGQSMFNLRKSLQTEDFLKIFDKRNRFIGDA